MNLLELLGHLGSDPETRVTPNGNKVTTFRMATNVRRNGKDETIWWRVTLWGTEFDKMLPHLKKGSAVIVIGEMMKPEIYTDKNGAQQVGLNMTAHIMRFSPFGKTDRENGAQGYAGAGNGGQRNQPFQGGESALGESNAVYAMSGEMEDDEIPF